MAADQAAEGWYVRARGRIQGPLSWTQIVALRERGQLARFDQLSRDRQTWTIADAVEGLFPHRGSGGAFVAPGGSPPRGGRGAGRPLEPDSDGFLIIDDEPGAPGDSASVEAAVVPVPQPSGWYYAEGGSPHGPVELSELERLAKQGRIKSNTLYWRSGLDQWAAGRDLTELARLWLYEHEPAQPGSDPSASSSSSAGVNLPPRSRPGEASSGAAVPAEPLALISLGLNLFCGIGSVAAIVVGVIALRRIARSNGTLGGRRIALAGVIVGVVGLVASLLAGRLLTVTHGPE